MRAAVKSGLLQMFQHDFQLMGESERRPSANAAPIQVIRASLGRSGPVISPYVIVLPVAYELVSVPEAQALTELRELKRSE